MTRRLKAKAVRFRDRRRTAAQRSGNPDATKHVRPDCPHPLKRPFTTEAQAVAEAADQGPKNSAYLCRCKMWHTTSAPQNTRRK